MGQWPPRAAKAGGKKPDLSRACLTDINRWWHGGPAPQTGAVALSGQRASPGEVQIGWEGLSTTVL